MEHYTIKRKENSSVAYESFRKREEYLDGVLICDEKVFYGHKLVLAANCAYFRRALRKLPAAFVRESSVILYNIPADLLEKNLDFIYAGEVCIPKNRYDEFVQLADNLGVRGIKREIEHEQASRRTLLNDVNPQLGSDSSSSSRSPKSAKTKRIDIRHQDEEKPNQPQIKKAKRVTPLMNAPVE
jgi:hypothetical protein